MYEDKLDGRIAAEYFDAKAAEMRTAQAAVMRDIQTHQNANRSYIEEGVQLLELAHNAHVLFESQPPAEKRKLLDFVLSNCSWKDGELTVKYRQPFDVLAVAVPKDQQQVGGKTGKKGKTENWLPENNPPTKRFWRNRSRAKTRDCQPRRFRQGGHALDVQLSRAIVPRKHSGPMSSWSGTGWR